MAIRRGRIGLRPDRSHAGIASHPQLHPRVRVRRNWHHHTTVMELLESIIALPTVVERGRVRLRGAAPGKSAPVHRRPQTPSPTAKGSRNASSAARDSPLARIDGFEDHKRQAVQRLPDCRSTTGQVVARGSVENSREQRIVNLTQQVAIRTIQRIWVARFECHCTADDTKVGKYFEFAVQHRR